MGQVRNKTQAALREFVYEDLGKDQLKQRFRRVERQMTGANPHNIGMATFEFTGSSTINKKLNEISNRYLLTRFRITSFRENFLKNGMASNAHIWALSDNCETLESTMGQL